MGAQKDVTPLLSVSAEMVDAGVAYCVEREIENVALLDVFVSELYFRMSLLDPSHGDSLQVPPHCPPTSGARETNETGGS